jgi:major membrane immunogen (membrane-anchored lipoprotein)
MVFYATEPAPPEKRPPPKGANGGGEKGALRQRNCPKNKRGAAELQKNKKNCHAMDHTGIHCYYRRDMKRILKKHTVPGLPVMALSMLLSASCASGTGGSGGGGGGQKLADGYYTAEAASYDRYGWKEYITIYVDNNNIVTVEYNAKNASGFLKSWDMDYMRLMGARSGTYPTAYSREYSAALLRLQEPEGIDALAGATDSYRSFKILAATAISQARAKNKSVALVELSGR